MKQRKYEQVEPKITRQKQAKMSTRWMPRRLRPKKDAETGETFGGSCIQAENPEIPNGATPPESCLETACPYCGQ